MFLAASSGNSPLDVAKILPFTVSDDKKPRGNCSIDQFRSQWCLHVGICLCLFVAVLGLNPGCVLGQCSTTWTTSTPFCFVFEAGSHYLFPRLTSNEQSCSASQVSGITGMYLHQPGLPFTCPLISPGSSSSHSYCYILVDERGRRRIFSLTSHIWPNFSWNPVRWLWDSVYALAAREPEKMSMCQWDMGLLAKKTERMSMRS
jgi:hypothetical protein